MEFWPFCIYLATLKNGPRMAVIFCYENTVNGRTVREGWLQASLNTVFVTLNVQVRVFFQAGFAVVGRRACAETPRKRGGD